MFQLFLIRESAVCQGHAIHFSSSRSLQLRLLITMLRSFGSGELSSFGSAKVGFDSCGWIWMDLRWFELVKGGVFFLLLICFLGSVVEEAEGTLGSYSIYDYEHRFDEVVSKDEDRWNGD